jgi:hypothetical protein
MNPGMSVIEPIIAAIVNPSHPELAPRYFTIKVSGIKKRTKLIRISMLRKGCRILKSIFQPFFRPRIVFLLSRIKDTIKTIPVNSPKISVLLSIIILHLIFAQ